MNPLLELCMYIAVCRTEPESDGKDRSHLVRHASTYYSGVASVDKSVWLATLDNLVIGAAAT